MGMKVLQFGFDAYTHSYLPHNYDSAIWACYTGTHDNDTIKGWYQHTSEEERHRFRVYTSSSGDQAHWQMIKLAWSSTAKWAITTMQDALGLDSGGRMNIPGEGGGNWSWRAHELPDYAADRLYSLNETFGRLQ
jgi:4-alpha-glucanotransferase